MTPKKAIIILLVLFLIVVTAFTFLYIRNQALVSNNGSIKATGGAGSNVGANKVLSPAEISQQKDERVKTEVQQIIEQGKNEFGGTNIDAIKAAEALANQRVQEKLNSRTPEQIQADSKRDAEIQKMLEEANNKVK